MKPISALVPAAVVAAGILGAQAAWAGDSTRLGTAGALVLRVPVGPRGTALSGSAVADATGVEAVYWNPAGVADVGGTEALFSTMSYLVDSRVNFFGIAKDLGSFGSLALAGKSLDMGDIPITTEAVGGPTGETYSPTLSVVGLSVARHFSDRVAFGVTANLVNESIRNEQASGVAFDFGFQYELPAQGIRFGAVMKSFGPKMRFEGPDFAILTNPPDADPSAANRTLVSESAEYSLPSSFEIGVNYHAIEDENNDVEFMTAFQSNTFAEDAYRFGGEYAWKNTLFFRAGATTGRNDEDAWKGTFGGGLRVPLGSSSLRVDYARLATSDFFDDRDLVSATLRF